MFYDTVQSIPDTKVVVFCLQPIYTPHNKGSELFREQKKVEKAIKRNYPDVSNFKVQVTSFHPRGKKFTIVIVPEKKASQLLNCVNIKIGWITCRVKRRTIPNCRFL